MYSCAFLRASCQSDINCVGDDDNRQNRHFHPPDRFHAGSCLTLVDFKQKYHTSAAIERLVTNLRADELTRAMNMRVPSHPDVESLTRILSWTYEYLMIRRTIDTGVVAS